LHGLAGAFGEKSQSLSKPRADNIEHTAYYWHKGHKPASDGWPGQSDRAGSVNSPKVWRKAMLRRPILFTLAILAFSAVSALPLCGQGVGGYGPYGQPPALSPWLNLYQKQGGPVDNYHMYVQPQLQLQNAFQAQRITNQRNAFEIDNVMSQMEAVSTLPQQTGVGATFMNHGVYFNNYRQAGLGSGTPGIAGNTQNRGNWTLPAANSNGRVQINNQMGR
jgi:hypothetical protein